MLFNFQNTLHSTLHLLAHVQCSTVFTNVLDCTSGNMFSTVRGHVFMWSLLKDEDALHQELAPEAILEFVPFADSNYATDLITETLESKVWTSVEGLVHT